MLERDVERKVCEYAKKTYGMLTYKWSSPSHRGVPDRIFISREGLIAFIEFKRPGAKDKITPLQHKVLTALSEYRCEVFVIDTVETGKKLVDLLSDAETYARVRYGRQDDIIVPTSVSDARH